MPYCYSNSTKSMDQPVGSQQSYTFSVVLSPSSRCCIQNCKISRICVVPFFFFKMRIILISVGIFIHQGGHGIIGGSKEIAGYVTTEVICRLGGHYER